MVLEWKNLFISQERCTSYDSSKHKIIPWIKELKLSLGTDRHCDNFAQRGYLLMKCRYEWYNQCKCLRNIHIGRFLMRMNTNFLGFFQSHTYIFENRFAILRVNLHILWYKIKNKT